MRTLLSLYDASTKEIARLLYLGRRRRKWSQAELAKRAGVARCTVIRLEQGTTPPSPSTLEKLDKVLW